MPLSTTERTKKNNDFQTTKAKMKSVDEFSIKTLEIAGLVGALNALRLPFGKECRSETNFSRTESATEIECASTITKDERLMADINLMHTLVKRGDAHGKVTRGIMVWCEINAPRYWHQEMDTYRVGAERLSSESTMHIQGKGMATEELVAMKESLPEGTMQKRVWMISYQTLRRIYELRHDHRLPQWRIFCEWIKTLPYADALILAGMNDD